MQIQRDRRIHRVFVTKNTEYHVRRDRCVAVRDRESGIFHPDHVALFRRIGAAIGYAHGGIAPTRELPSIGQSLLFDGSGTITTPVVAVERPPRDLVERYPILAEPDRADGASNSVRS